MFSSCLPGARFDLRDEDNTVVLALMECSTRPYAELIRSNIPGSSSLKHVRSPALRPSPPSTLGVFSFRPVAATPTWGEILVHLEGMSRKPRSVKRKNLSSFEKDRPVPAKVQKLGASPPSPVHEPERAVSPLVLSLRPPSKPDARVKGLSGATVKKPLTVEPITVWNPPFDDITSSPRGVAEPRGKKSKPKAGVVKDYLLSNAELAAGVVSSILKESDIGRSKEFPVDEALALSFQGFASVSL